jgi:acetyltransferase-like isoleucine patch superfamily enzyme
MLDSTEGFWIYGFNRELRGRFSAGIVFTAHQQPVKSGKNYVPLLAPIVLFVHARPDHTRRTLEALARNPESRESLLYIFADGATPSASVETRAKISQVRAILREKPWCGEVRITESETNRGLADSIVGGVTEVVRRHGKVIVLEDDIVVQPGFIRYMNDALNLYADEASVMQVSAYSCPTRCRPSCSSYFLKAMSCWGWATWERAWNCFESDAEMLLAYWTREPTIEHRFNLDESADYIDQLKANVDGRKRTWAVKWFASWMKQGGLCLYPRESLVENIGHDGSGENCFRSNIHLGPLAQDLKISRIPLKEDPKMRESWVEFYQNHITFYRNYPGMTKTLLKHLSGYFGLSFIRRAVWYGLTKINPNLKILDRDGFRFYYDSFRLHSDISELAQLGFPHHVESSVIGKYSYIAQNCWIIRTRIGRFCSIGPNFCCGWATHPTNGISTSPMFYSTRMQNGVSLCSEDKVCEFGRIEIGNDVFIGMNVTVLDGVQIGDGAIIGAGAVVSKDIPPYAVAVGSPIKIIRYRFDSNTIARLLETQWWNWSEKDLQQVEQRIFDVNGFLDYHCRHETESHAND